MLRTIVLLAALACVPATAAAQIVTLDPAQRTIHRELRRYEDRFELTDMTHEVWTAELPDDETTSLMVPLEPGEEYVIMAVCDEGCDDIDLRLFSGSTLVDEDIEDDDYPVVQVSPGSARTYRIEVVMASCDASPCRYGLAIYSK